MKKHLNYRYVTFYTPLGKGRACLYISSDKNKETGEIVYDVAASFCSPKDTFQKDRARKISEGRMAKAKMLTSKFMGDEGKQALTTDDITNIVFEVINYYPLTPTWAKKALERETVAIGLD